MDRSVVTVAVRLNDGNAQSLALRQTPGAENSAAGAALRIAPTAYSLGAARGYKSFAQSAAPAAPIRQLDAPDLASYQPKPGVAATPSRFAPAIALDEREKTGRSPRTFEQSDQQVDLGGSYRVSRNLDLTAGVRVFDSSIGGLGGCPFAPNATGNIGTEDLVYMLERAGYSTGYDLDGLIGTAKWMAEILGKPPAASVSRAGGFPMAQPATA